MKCTECPEYIKCQSHYDLRSKRRRCPKAKEPKIYTNSDKIRAMTDEELADFLILSPEMEFDICCLCEYGNTTPTDDRGQCLALYACDTKARADAFKKWLKQPYGSPTGQKG